MSEPDHTTQPAQDVLTDPSRWSHIDDRGHKIQVNKKRGPEGTARTVELDMTALVEQTGIRPTGNPEILAYSRLYGKGRHIPTDATTLEAAKAIVDEHGEDWDDC